MSSETALLSRLEKYCVSLCEKIYTGEATPISCPRGIFAHFVGGRILHCIDFYTVDDCDKSIEIFNFFKSYFSKSKKSIFSIIGEKRGTEIIRQAIEKAKGIKPEHVQEYFLLEWNGDAVISSVAERNEKTFQKINLATQKEFPELVKMQYDYETEEVAYNDYEIDEEISAMNLKKNINDNRVYFFRHNNEIVSKLSINAKGKNYIQIGGVFTKVDYRNKGFAKKMIADFLELQRLEEKSVVLFVKKENLAARRLYENLNFKTVGEYEICYF